MSLQDVRLLHDQRVPMRDGISLSADVYLPLSGGPHPTIYQWTPYESTRERFVGWGVWFAQRGYAAVVSDVRGRYESEGEFEAWSKDGVDAQDSLTWAVGEAWCNGRIGTWGRSYGALVQWQLLHQGHPNLECVAPQVIHDDYFWDGYWTGGAFQLALTLGAAAIWTSAISLVTSPSAGTLLLNDRVWRHLPLIELDEVTIGRKVGYWREWWEHQENDAYWHQFHHRPETVTVPIFQQGGWFDPYSGSHLRSFAAIGDRVPNRVLMGPWSHEEEVETFRGDVDLSAGSDRDSRPRARLLRPLPPRRGERLGGAPAARALRPRPERVARRERVAAARNRVHVVLPAERGAARPRRAALRRAGRPLQLRPRGPRADDRRRQLGADDDAGRGAADPPRPVGSARARGARTTCSRTRATSSTSDVEVIGPVEMVLFAASSAKDTDFFVRVCDVYPDGRSIFLTEGIIRARYRNSHEGDSTELLEPGEVAEYRIRCYPMANVFEQGHRIRLDVTSSSFPRFSRNLNTGEDVGTGTRIEVAQQTVLHTDVYPSHVVLPVVS